MRVELYQSPVLGEPSFTGTLNARLSILQILEETGAPEWFMSYGVIRMNGTVISRDDWSRIKIKPEAEGILELCVIPQKKSTLVLVATVVLVAAATAVSLGALGPAGLGLLGASFAAGGLGASALAAGIGIAGSLLLRQLTAPPVSALSASESSATKDLSFAGITANTVTPLETLPVLWGKMLVSPPLISVPYTTLNNKSLTVHAIAGIQGRSNIANVLINGTDAALLEGFVYETRQGAVGDAPLTLCQLICIQNSNQLKIDNYDLLPFSASNDQLADQTTPANSLPTYKVFTTDGVVDEIWLRFIFPSGIFRTTDNTVGVIPIRIELRRASLNNPPWVILPTIHVQDSSKGSGSLRVEIKIRFIKTPTVPIHGVGGADYPVAEIYNITGIGQTFAYTSHVHFQVPTYAGITGAVGFLPLMTGPTTGTWTVSASTELGASNQAWNAVDGSGATNWAPTANSLPAWWRATNTTNFLVKSVYIVFAAVLTTGVRMYFETSANGTVWSRVDDATLDQSFNPISPISVQITNPISARWFRITFETNNGAANEQLQVSNILLFAHEAPGTPLQGLSGPSVHTSGGLPRIANATLTPDGAEIYLDPQTFPIDQYEVRIKRGCAVGLADLNLANYAYLSSTANADFFGYATVSGKAVCRVAQSVFRSDTILETYSSVSNQSPVDTTGVSCIAMELTDGNIDTISANFNSYAPTFVAGAWTVTESNTVNPAALYRKLLIGDVNPDPTPLAIIDDLTLGAWYDRCEANGYEVGAITQGRSIDEVKQLIAYCGYASPRDTALVSVAQDYDRTAQSVTQTLSPLNSKNRGFSLAMPRLPHAIYAEYLWNNNNYKVQRDIIYRTGYTSANATLFDTINYEGFTNKQKVAARAKFDLLQMELRAASYTYEIGIEGYSIERGDLIGLNDDTINLKNSFGLIQSIQVSGPNTTGITVDNIIPFSTIGAAGVAIRLSDGTSVVKTLTNVTDSNACIFTTPFTTAGSGISLGALCAFGAAGSEFKRVIVTAIQPNGLDTRTITLKDEAPGIWL